MTRKLTREECENALMDFEIIHRDGDQPYSAFKSAQKDVKTLWQLIHDHFEKETPKKLFMRKIKKFDGHNEGRCECGQWLDDCMYDEMNYCPKCGQKIDWSEHDVD